MVALALAAGGCGGSNGTDGGGPKPGGTLRGDYQLELKLSSRCTATGLSSVTLPMVVATAGSSPHPGVQATLAGAQPGLLELELKYTDYLLEGGFGTADLVPSDQGPKVWLRAIGTGPVTQAAAGRGEVVSGSLRGDLEIGGDGYSPCTATDHSFSLRPR